MIEQIPGFTAQANNAVYMARRVAFWLKHNSVNPDILLLGIIGEKDCAAGKILAELGVEFNNASAILKNRIGLCTDECDLKAPLSGSVKEIFDNARLKSDMNYVSSNLLLWMLLNHQSEDNKTLQILTDLKVDVEALNQRLLNEDHPQLNKEFGVLEDGSKIQWKAVFKNKIDEPI